MDSRGTGLYEKISKMDRREFIGVWKKSGATFDEVVELAKAHLTNYPFDVVYVVGGVNDITTKDRLSGNITFDWNPPELLIQHLQSKLKLVDCQLTKDFPASKVVFCPLVGSDLERIVTKRNADPLQQLAVNEAVFDFNSEIFKINKRRETFSPSLDRTVRRSKTEKRRATMNTLRMEFICLRISKANGRMSL